LPADEPPEDNSESFALNSGPVKTSIDFTNTLVWPVSDLPIFLKKSKILPLLPASVNDFKIFTNLSGDEEFDGPEDTTGGV